MNIDRKLASIVSVDSISSIENADAIEVANVMGWKCVIKKNTFVQGDKAVYFEIDSMLSVDDQRFNFLAPFAKIRTMDGIAGYVIVTKKLRGVYSQGLLLPISEFPEVADKNIGDDVTAILNVRKYEPPAEGDGKHLSGDPRGSFPGGVPRTDQPRCISGGTQIVTENGNMTIKDMCENRKAVKVLSFNHSNNIAEYQSVIDWSIMTRKQNWVKITTKSGKIITVTKNHRIFIENLQCYRTAQNLKVGDMLKILTKN